MFGLQEYVLAVRGQDWPAGEGLIRDPAGGAAIAVVRAEPWPEVLERPWPDGARGRPWLWRLLGAGRNPDQSRTTVRRLSDGRPLVRLHRRQGLFNETVGIFDGDDRRVGYCRWAFKGTGPRDEFAIVRADHSQVGEVCRAGGGRYRVARTSGGRWAEVAVSGRESTRAVRIDRGGDAGDGDGVFLLAAVIVLYRLGSFRGPTGRRSHLTTPA